MATALPAAAEPPGPQEPRRRIVGVLETHAPGVEEFLLRGTLPVPRGTFPAADGAALTVIDYDGTPLATQVESVSSYSDADDGADVVELLARVRRDPGLEAGVPSRFAVALLRQVQAPPAPPAPVPEEVRELLLAPRGLEITSYDCFGNKYVSRPFGLLSPFTVLRRGPVQAEVRVHQQMLPEPPREGSTLPHLLGVHAYVSWFAGSSTVGLDLRFHNAQDGHDPASKLDDPLDRVYFERIELTVPRGWVVLQDFPDPLFGSERISGGRRSVALVGPNPSGGLHVMRWQGQFHRRLALAPDRPDAVLAARAQLDGAGRAFCTRGLDGRGQEYWSWWNPETARYFPQRHRLPLLDHVGDDALEATLAGQLGFLAAHLASGLGTGDYPLASNRLGWGHPHGVSYGGMTSGLEIHCYEGLETAAAASPTGYRYYTLLHRMQTDRQPNALYRLDGEPSSVEEWLVENGEADYVPFLHYNVPLTHGSRPDPFGIRSAPQFQNDFVAANGLQPGYESAHLGFDPHDLQHLIRYTRSAKLLVWLGNDSLALDDLRMQAESFHLAYHPYANDASGNAQTTGLLDKLRFVQQHPGNGFPFGRGEGWGLDCAVAVYATADGPWRARKLPWLMRITDVLLQGQAACSGFIQAMISDKAVDGRYRARQAIEQSIAENALVGLHESVFTRAHPAFAAIVRDVLADSLRAFISEMSWFSGESGPWRFTGVGPLNPALPAWCSRAEMPADAWTAGDISGYLGWSSLAYGYELTRDFDFLRHARIQIGGSNFPDLVARLLDEGTENLENRAALLALVQELAGLY
jgi:hypothetical protein